MPIFLSDEVLAAGNFAVVNSKNVTGANQSVATLTERDSISDYLRVAGMVCYVAETQKYYSLGNDLTTWSEFSGGLASPVELYSWACGENIQAYQLVFFDRITQSAIIADCVNLAGANKTIGVSLQSKVAGEIIEVVTRGWIVNPLWDWSVDALFLGSSGQFSTSLPVKPCLLWKVAQVTSSSAVFFNPRSPLIES